ncbi:MAG: hypothetical protein Tsb0027_06590 [Wenzhouxiangellaceae bacterium]
MPSGKTEKALSGAFFVACTSAVSKDPPAALGRVSKQPGTLTSTALQRPATGKLVSKDSNPAIGTAAICRILVASQLARMTSWLSAASHNHTFRRES